MRISEVIEVLKKYQEKNGDVELHYQNGDGYASWISPYNPVVVHHKPWPATKKIYEIRHSGY